MYGAEVFGGWVRTSAEVDKLVPALLAAQKELGAVHKDSEATIVSKRTGGKFKYTYVSLPRVLEVAKPVYNKHGILIIQGTGGEGKKVRVATRFMHESGQWAETDAGMEAADESPRAIGSAISYGRRYTFIVLAAIAPDDDDDGAAAEGINRNGAPLAVPAANRTEAFGEAWGKVMKAVGEDDADVVVAMRDAYVYALTKGRTTSLTGLTDAELKTGTNKLKGKKKDTVEWFTSGAWKISTSDPAGMQQVESGGDDRMQAVGPTCHECGKQLTHGEADACAMMKTKHGWCKDHIAAGKATEMALA